MIPFRLRAQCSLALALLALPLGAQQPAARGGAIDSLTRGMERRDGFVPVDVDVKKGRVLLEVPRDSLRALFFVEEATGFGSNPLGFDRGGEITQQVVRLVRTGDRVLVVFENWNYRASAGGAQQQVVDASFAPSTIASLPVLGEQGDRVLVDATDFFVRDWVHASVRLREAHEGDYSLQKDRAMTVLAYTKAFPQNTEVEVAETWATNGNAGNTVGATVPDGSAFTLRVHFSLVQLPDDNYRPRANDPRVGYFTVDFKDYSQPFTARLQQLWITRFRLQRKDPNDPKSPIANPIVYYIDRGIPEPMRSATVEGAKFWTQAFDQAGLTGGFVVKDLPEGADPMDVRYNTVLWLDRNERGWSFAGPSVDPRTGETIKGIAHLDSHRNRTAHNLYAALMGVAPSAADTHFVLGRVRQVTAHEIGHSLGLQHNYIASTYERASVMDYPAPRVLVDAQGKIDVSQAYAVGPGAYDVWAIRWGYGIFPPASEADSLLAIVKEGLGKGYLFLTDQDARPEFASDPRTVLWDDAATADEFLKRQMAVRDIALRQFGLRNLAAGEPVAVLQDRFVPLYLFHRFALNAVARTVGGLEYSFALNGDGQNATRMIDAARQRAALGMLMHALAPSELAISDSVISLMAPAPPGYSGGGERFKSRTRPAFDEFAAISMLSAMITDALLQPDRDARLVQFAGRTSNPVTLAEVFDSLARATGITGAAGDAKSERIRRVTRRHLIDRTIALAADSNVGGGVRAIANYELNAWQKIAKRRAAAGSVEERAHWSLIASDIGFWFEEGKAPVLTMPLNPPPGDPFGEEDE